MERVVLEDAGLVGYAACLARQRELFDRLVSGKVRESGCEAGDGCPDAVIGRRGDHRLLEEIDVLPQSETEPLQVEDRIADELTRTVERDITATVGPVVGGVYLT